MGTKNSRIKLSIVLGVLFILLWFLLFFLFKEEKSLINTTETDFSQEENEITKDTKEKIFLPDYSLKQTKRNLPVSVVIDNFSQSWPITGINQAAVIYEAPVEADITRLLAIFDPDNLPEQIGPVRSARPYLAEWAEEYQGMFIHAGGSPCFLSQAQANSYQIFNLDEISHNNIYFWRDKTKDRPHNLYIDKEAILKTQKDKQLLEKIKPGFVYWTFNSEKNFFKNPTNLIVKINYREPVVWQYDQETESYLRFQNKEPFLDSQGKQVRTKNVVIQETSIEILDSIGHRKIITQGQGRALFFQKGFLAEGIWQKTDKAERTLFFNKKNQEVKFLPGSVWIEVVSPQHEVIY